MTHSTLQLTFTKKSEITNLTHSKHYGSLIVQRALHPESSPTINSSDSGNSSDLGNNKNDICHVMILNPAAGIALGDELVIDTKLEQNTHAVLTTTGAGKWYGKGKSHIGEIIDSRFVNMQDEQEIDYHNDASVGMQRVHIDLADNSRCEWIPQENIIFDDANIKAITEFTLASSASLLTWDILVLGRQAYNERFLKGKYANDFVIKRQNDNGKVTPIVYETVNQLANSRWFNSPLGVNGHHVIGTFWAIPEVHNKKFDKKSGKQPISLDDTIEQLRELIETMHLPVVCTATKEGICIRYLGDDVRACFTAFSELRHVIRKLWWGVEAYEPRIWHT